MSKTSWILAAALVLASATHALSVRAQEHQPFATPVKYTPDMPPQDLKNKSNPPSPPATAGSGHLAVVNAKTAAQPSPPPGHILYDQTREASVRSDPLNWDVTIYKARHELIVYYKGRWFKTYPAVFGRNLDHAAKEYANDRRTPEGVYSIIRKYSSRRFGWFLRLNYPNLIDRQRYEKLRAERVVPVDDGGRMPKVGGAIGIHGTDVPLLNQGLVDWTTGCISVSNDAVAELNRFLPVGTVVIIKP